MSFITRKLAKSLVMQPKYYLYLHEYQAYDLLKKYKLNLIPSFRANTPQDAENIAKRMMQNTSKSKPFVDVVVKAQVHSGGRGKGYFKESGLKGGVQVATKPEQVKQFAQKMLGQTLITHQTGSIGRKCNEIFLVEKIFLRKELYLSLTLDRSKGKMAVITSQKGGMSVEDVQASKMFNFNFELQQEIPSSVLDEIVKSYELNEDLSKQMSDVIRKLYQCFVETDAILIEINPLGVTIDGNLVLADQKFNIDDNAQYRQQSLFMLEDLTQKNWKEVQAQRHGLNYIALQGNIGCMVNGAGLAMATMDLIKSKNGTPANFLDVGGKATDEQVTEALKLMDSDPNVEAVLVNIFAGIARCDVIALGLLKGISVTGMKKPIVLRLKGTMLDEAKQIMQDSGFNMIVTEDLEDAAEKAVKMAAILKMAREAKLNINLL